MNTLLNEIQTTAALLFSKGWAEAFACNFSVNVTKDFPYAITLFDQTAETIHFDKPFSALSNHSIIITATGSRIRELSISPEKYLVFLQLSETGDKLTIKSRGTPQQPSSEFLSHLELHSFFAISGTAKRAIVHAHATRIIALTHHPAFKTSESITNLLLKMHPESALIIPRGCSFVPLAQSTGRQAPHTLQQALQKHDLAVWEKHGLWAAGKSLAEASDKIEVTEKALEIYFQCKSAGFEPEGLDENQIRELIKS